MWFADIAIIVLATYWWIGFLAKYNIPSEPFFPEVLYPRPWAYLGMAACFGAWALVTACCYSRG